MLQAALQTVLKSDAEGKECCGLNSFLCRLDGNNIFWVQKGMDFPQQQLLLLSVVLSDAAAKGMLVPFNLIGEMIPC